MTDRIKDAALAANIIHRTEHFGGIVAVNDPPALLYVDRHFMRELGVNDSPLWQEDHSHLSAPTEAHFNVTGFCPLSCSHCTSNSGSGSNEDMSFEEIKAVLDTLAEMKVFHVALGGGELFSRSDAIAIARYARSRGIIPNATTNGYYLTTELAAQCGVFGQINVSLDGIAEKYGAVRGVNIFPAADRALKLLVEAGVSAGVNCIAARSSFDHLEDVVAYAARLGLKEVLFLRLKPSGRARSIYLQQRLTHEQNIQLFPKILKLAKEYPVNIQVDCSFVPHLCYHEPAQETMATFGIEGCEGGNALLGIRHDGHFNACSHSDEFIAGTDVLEKLWNTHEHFARFRERAVSHPVCQACGYFDLCRGGCPLFSSFLLDDFSAADPECPVIAGSMG